MRAASIILLALLFGSCSSRGGTEPASATPVPEPPAVVQMRRATAFYDRHEYKNAIEPYKRALELDKQSPALSRDLRIVLIDNLAMAQGITRDIAGARETLNYGISIEPEYPMFYYIMACTYGEEADEANSIRYLTLAHERRANALSGEHLPEPLADPSFAKLKDRPSFRNAIEKMSSEPRPAANAAE